MAEALHVEYSGKKKSWEADYVDGKLHGEKRDYFSDGELWQITNWRHGKQHGHAVEYSDKNKTWEADYADGKVLRGERREYFGNGELRQITNYENDARHGRFWRRIDEITEVEGQFEKGWPMGLWKRRVFQTKDDKKVLLREESFDCATQRGDEVLEYLVDGFKDEAKQQLGF